MNGKTDGRGKIFIKRHQLKPLKEKRNTYE